MKVLPNLVKIQKLQTVVILVYFLTTLFCLQAEGTLTLNRTDPTVIKVTMKNVESVLKVSPNYLGSSDVCAHMNVSWHPTFWSKLLDPEEIVNRCKIAGNFCTDHVLEISGLFVLSSYVWIRYQIQQTNVLFKNVDAWCNWQSNISIPDLKLQSEQDLFQQLKIDIEAKYFKIKKDTSENTKRAMFDYIDLLMRDITLEFEQLNTYKKWYERTRAIYCNTMFNFYYDLAVIQEKQERLLLIINLCKDWCFS